MMAKDSGKFVIKELSHGTVFENVAGLDLAKSKGWSVSCECGVGLTSKELEKLLPIELTHGDNIEFRIRYNCKKCGAMIFEIDTFKDK